MSDHEALLAVIIAQPDEDTPRLVYADWLDEHGATVGDRARAEFIRAQIQANRLPPDAPARAPLETRAAELLAAHQRSWLPPGPDPLALFFEWRRGFVTVLDPAARGVFGSEDGLKGLAAFPLAEDLDLSFCVSDEEFRHMPALPNLRSFEIGGIARITNVSVARIGCWRTLRRLKLNVREITDDALPLLSNLVDLRELDLSYSGITDAGLPHLAPLASLEALDLSQTGVTGSGLAALQAHPRLRCLNLNDTPVWRHGIIGLAGCRSLQELRFDSGYYGHYDRPLTDADLAPLRGLTALRVLELGGWHELSPGFVDELRRTLPLEVFRCGEEQYV